MSIQSNFNESYQYPPINLLRRNVVTTNTEYVEALKKQIIPLGNILCSQQFQESTMQLPCAIGQTPQNEAFMFDLAQANHVIVAGASGQGKTACLNAMICSLLYKRTPAELKFVLMDPKDCGYDIYDPLKYHFLAELSNEEGTIFTEPEHCLRVMHSLESLMDLRYEKLKETNVKNIVEYKQKFPNLAMPYIVIVIDEFGDLISALGKDFIFQLTHLAELGHRVGMHLVISTQHLTYNIISGRIRANFPARIALKVADCAESRTILDYYDGAQNLIGKGDMLASINSSEPIRLLGAFVENNEIMDVVSYIAKQKNYENHYELPAIDNL